MSRAFLWLRAPQVVITVLYIYPLLNGIFRCFGYSINGPL
jgi:hypothetical protein